MTECPIVRYCRERGIPHAEFARAIGVSPQHISHVIAKRRGCSTDLIQAIEEKTGGAISAQEMIDWLR